MQTRIGHIRISYRVPRGSPSASALVPTLERVAHERLAAVCERAFSRVFEDDPAVHVVRKVSARVAVLSRRATFESRIAEQWGHRLCAAVMEAIKGDGNSENVVRFENQSEFVARFLIDLAVGKNVWGIWYYGCFRRYRKLPDADAILAVFEDNREWLGDILRRLRLSGRLETVLARMGAAGQQKLWRVVIRGATPPEASTEAFRVFMTSALRVVDALDLWSAGRPSDAAALDAYLQSRPATPQWTNTASLSNAVADAIQFLLGAGWLARPVSLRPEHLSELERVLAANFDWLDTVHLSNRVRAIFRSPPAHEPEKKFVLRPPGATPAQKRLLEMLSRRVVEGGCRLEAGDTTPHSNLLRLLAALTEQVDASACASITPLLESIVAVWLVLHRTGRSRETLSQLRQGSLATLPQASRFGFEATTAAHLQAIASAGESAVTLVEHLIKQSDGGAAVGESVSVESSCAGLFLLVRTLQDLRIQAVLKECEFDSTESLLTGLSIRIGGAGAWRNGVLDDGAALWAGIEAKEAVARLNHLETLNRRRFEAAFLDLISAQRLFNPLEHPPVAPEQELPGCSGDLIALLDHTSGWLLQAWARWLPGLGNSSVPYLLRNFIRRPGAIEVSPRFLDVHLVPGALDVVLKMAGYLSETPEAFWLGNRRVRFSLGG